MDEEINIIRIVLDDYKQAGGYKWDLLNRAVNDIYAEICKIYSQDDDSRRFQAMILSLYAVLVADSDQSLMVLIKNIPFVLIPVKQLHDKLMVAPVFSDVINKIRTMFAGTFIKLYFDLYKKAESEYDTLLVKNMHSALELNRAFVKKLIHNKETSFNNYKNVLCFCDRYRPTVGNKIKLSLS